MAETAERTQLKRIARAKRESGQLPPVEGVRVWAGRGTGDLCALCEKPILAEEVEYEVEWQQRAQTATFRFHLVCSNLWGYERDSE